MLTAFHPNRSYQYKYNNTQGGIRIKKGYDGFYYYYYYISHEELAYYYYDDSVYYYDYYYTENDQGKGRSKVND